MQPYEKIQEYSKTVCEQIKWKKTHAIITEEIENHLIDQRDAYIADGAGELDATDQAIAQMGDPVAVGTQLDHTHCPKPQWGMLVLTIVIASIGVFFDIFLKARTLDNNQWTLNSLYFSLTGLALMTAFYYMDFTWIGRYPKRIYFFLLFLLSLHFIMREIFNCPLGVFYYEGFISLLFPLGFAGIVYSNRNKGYRGIFLCGISFLLPAWIMFLMQFRSDFMLFAISALVILCVFISKGWFKVKIINGYLLVFIPVAIFILLVMLYIFESYRWEKVLEGFNPSIDPLGQGYLGMRIKAVLEGSKIIGQGVVIDAATGEFVHGYSSFYSLTYLIFYTGWIPFLLIMCVLLFFIVMGFKHCFKQKNGFALFVSLSVMIIFTVQVLGYIMNNLGIRLFLHTSLPLITLDDLAFFTNFALVGLMLSVFRTGYIVKDKNFHSVQSKSFIRYIDGEIIVSLIKKQ